MNASRARAVSSLLLSNSLLLTLLAVVSLLFKLASIPKAALFPSLLTLVWLLSVLPKTSSTLKGTVLSLTCSFILELL